MVRFDLSGLRGVTPTAPIAAPRDATTPAVLFVCTGNICRSPLAALVARERLRDLEVMIDSAGTHALVGAPMTDEAIELAVARGVPRADAAAHTGRWLREQDLASPHLVLTLDRAQRHHVVGLAPSSIGRLFTLREFARIVSAGGPPDVVGSTPVDRLRNVVAQVADARGRVTVPPDPAEDDVIDPYRRSMAVYERSAEQSSPALETVVALVRQAIG